MKTNHILVIIIAIVAVGGIWYYYHEGDEIVEIDVNESRLEERVEDNIRQLESTMNELGDEFENVRIRTQEAMDDLQEELDRTYNNMNEK